MHEAQRHVAHVFRSLIEIECRCLRRRRAQMDPRQRSFERRATRLQVRRQHEPFAQVRQRLVQREAGRVGRQFEQHTARLPKIHRPEILPVPHLGGMEAGLDHTVPHRQFGGIIPDAERHMMHGPGATGRRPEPADAPHVDQQTCRSTTHPVAPGRAVLADGPETERIGKDLLGRVAGLGPDRHRMDAAYGLFRRHPGRAGPAGARLGGRITDQFQHQSVRIGKGQDLLGAAGHERPAGGSLVLHAVADEPFDPEADRLGQDRERRDRDLSGSVAPGPGAGPGKEREEAAGSAGLVAEVEVIGLGVVEVHGALDQPEAEHAGVEVEIALGIPRDGGDMVKAEDAGHGD